MKKSFCDSSEPHNYKQILFKHTFRDGNNNSGGWEDEYIRPAKIYCTKCGKTKKV